MDESQETESCPNYHDEDNAGENKPVDIAEGRLYIKLKFPMAEQSNGEETGMQGGEQLENPQVTKDYVCDFCDKRFSSGKGLGGHKRVHTQPSKRNHQFLHKNIHKPKFKKSGGVDDGSLSKAKKHDIDATCLMCGKTFPSMKSLFGHMRSHPDREWRGIHPPARSNHIMSVSIVDSAGPCRVHDRASQISSDALPQSTLGSLTGKRQISSDALLQSTSGRVTGKRQISSDALLQSTSGRVTGKRRNKLRSMSSVELEASDNLLLLAKGNHALLNSLSTSGLEGKSAPGDNYNAEEVIKGEHDDKTQASPELVEVSTKQKIKSSPPDKKVKKEFSRADLSYTTTVREGKGKGKMDEFQGCDEDADDKGCTHERSNEAESNCEDREYKSTQYQLELNILVEKGNIKKKRMKRLPRNLEAGAEVACCINHSRKISKTPERFKCNICNKSFSTHQALGGHMSSHTKVTIKKSRSGDDHKGSASADLEANERAVAAAATQEAETDGGADAQCLGDSSGDGAPSVQALGCKMLVIDLNELPPMDEDEQEG
ncbi:hypothetical protein ACJRO7_023822 [Eucalyptus globulus]|uniref:C2H2-type domain-containing protein n=1 Tax=Eucalyptus globulus TaxID=34317 RepID=A0ABD3KCA2_EUCGL